MEIINNELEFHCKFLKEFILKDLKKVRSSGDGCYSCGESAGMEIIRWRIWYWKITWKIADCDFCNKAVKENDLNPFFYEELRMLEKIGHKL